MDVRAIDFKHRWRQLRAVGWTPKRPSGLAKDWTYTSLIGKSFVGEDAVVTFAIESGLIVDESGESEETASGNEVVPSYESVTASQIDTSIALLANTAAEMFGSDSDFEPDADGQLEQSDHDDHTSDGDGGSADGGKSMEDVESVEGNADARVAVEANDVNVMADGKLGDEVIELREYPDDTLELDEDVAHMDDAFVEASGGKLTLKAIDKDAIRRFARSVPSSELEPYSGGYL
ncbi:hypothetical protein PC128_g26570 [Phytophthora cactorum]|nr:hypothetical protein PC128_g26570 [Phytophthora cactorum]